MTINPIELQKHLSGVDYPTDRESLVRAAESNGADDEIVSALRNLSKDSFDSPTEVNAAISEGD